jgi:5-(carboxyamino)imidazole ribonucleotide mutase
MYDELSAAGITNLNFRLTGFVNGGMVSTAPAKVKFEKVVGGTQGYNDFVAHAKDKGFGAIISFAGKAAHLGGVLAAHTTLPVIGVPVKSSTLDGLDALLATVQMPSGVPVATVAIDGAENAAILAVQMLAIYDDELAQKLSDFKKKMEQTVLSKDAELNKKLKEAKA